MKRLTCALVVAVVFAGCGGADGDRDTALVVSAASSLQTAFTAYGERFGDVRLSFGGSDELAAQIRNGVKPDVYASASASLSDDLFAEGLVERPIVFARNRLVLAVPAQSSAISHLEDVTRPGVDLAVGSASAPVGVYTREMVSRLAPDEQKAILANVRSEEPDVKGIVGKLAQGAVDAGFVYVTDVAATHGALRAIELPDDIAPPVAYGVAVVAGADHPRLARAFIDGLLDGDGRSALRRAGFAPSPRP